MNIPGLMLKTLFALVALLLTPQVYCAGVPPILHYQSFLTDSAGAAIDGSPTIVFCLYTTPSSITSEWCETQAVSVTRGLFSVRLGSVTGFPVNLFENNSSLYLGVRVGTDPEMIPRRPVASTGFAFKAGDADRLEGMSAASLDQSVHGTHIDNPHNVTAVQVGALDQTAIDNHATDAAAHHPRYANDEAVSAMGVNNNANPLNHDRLTEVEVLELIPDQIQTLSVAGTDLTLSNGGGTVSVADNDNDSGNEWNSAIAISGTALQVTDLGGVRSVDLAEKLSIDDLSDAYTDATNFGVGANTLSGNTSGYNNSAAGNYALELNATGNHNTAFGGSALNRNTDGNFNIGVGFLANYWNQAGSNNTVVGYRAGSGTGPHSKSDNVFLGYQAGYKTTGSRNVFLGNNAGFNETGSDKLYIDNSSTTTPLIYGNFDSNEFTVNGSLDLTGYGTFGANLGIGAAPDPNTQVKIVGSADIPTNLSIHNRDDSSAHLHNVYGVEITVDGVTNYSSQNHNGVWANVSGADDNRALVGIATDSAATRNFGVWAVAANGTLNYAGYFDGDLVFTGALIQGTSQRSKENITPIENALDILSGINGVYYNTIDSPDKTRVGVIAQEVQQVLPEAVQITDLENGHLGVDYTRLVPVLIEAVKGQRAQISALTKMTDTVRDENTAIKSLLCIDHPKAAICP